MSFEAAYSSREDLKRYGNNGLLLFALEMRFQIDDIHTVAADALTDGNDDKKCDLIYVDIDQGHAVVAQGYYRSDGQRQEAPANKASDLNTAAGWLLSRHVDDLPMRIRPAAMQLHAAIEEGKISTLQFWYVHNLPQSLNVREELRTVQGTAVAGLKSLLGSVDVPGGTVLEVGRETLTDWYQSLTTPILVQNIFELGTGQLLLEHDWDDAALSEARIAVIGKS